jgi:multidrug resistance efflux pump
MKMITNNTPLRYFLFAGLFLLMACGGKKKDNEIAQAALKDSLTRPENVSVVAAIAKVEPADGLIELSTATSGIVAEIYKNAGDSLKKGDHILKIDAANDALNTEVVQKQILTQKARAAADEAAVAEYRASLKEKTEDLAVSEKLVLTGAETQQNVSIKQKEKEVLAANLQKAILLAQASRADVSTLQKQLQLEENTAADKLVKATQNGVLVRMDANKGSAISALMPFASLAPEGDLVLHGEIDEMFAALVKPGQKVSVNYIGNKEKIAEGTVIFLSPILESKSLFYEESGESSDRRVRRFKVSLSTGQPLLINAKVECSIQIK